MKLKWSNYVTNGRPEIFLFPVDSKSSVDFEISIFLLCRRLGEKKATPSVEWNRNIKTMFKLIQPSPDKTVLTCPCGKQQDFVIWRNDIFHQKLQSSRIAREKLADHAKKRRFS